MRSRAAVSVLFGLVLCVPFALVAKAQMALAESALDGSVETLLRLTAPLTAVPPEPVAPGAEAALSFDVAGTQVPPLASKVLARRARASASPAKPQALFVSADSVLRLSKSAAQPSGSFVPKTAQHPAGLRLQGVAPLGIGVQDGDILIDAMGIAPRSSGEIVGAIIQARARRVRYLSGTLWRSGQTFRITVEQPYADPA